MAQPTGPSSGSNQTDTRIPPVPNQSLFDPSKKQSCFVIVQGYVVNLSQLYHF